MAEILHESRYNKTSATEVSEQSVNNVINVIQLYFPLAFDGLDQTIKKSDLDYDGKDLILFPSRALTNLSNLPIVYVQVKSSEDYVAAFFTKGKKKYGTKNHRWRDDGLTLLNGQWHQETLIADFVCQVSNLVGQLHNPDWIRQFLDLCHPFVRQSYQRSVATGILEQYRGSMYRWVAGYDKIPQLVYA